MIVFVALATRTLKHYNDRNHVLSAPGTTPKKDSTKGPTMSVMSLSWKWPRHVESGICFPLFGRYSFRPLYSTRHVPLNVQDPQQGLLRHIYPMKDDGDLRQPLGRHGPWYWSLHDQVGRGNICSISEGLPVTLRRAMFIKELYGSSFECNRSEWAVE